MSRSLRIQYPGAMYHVTVRGNARQRIYCDDTDRRMFYSRMEASIERSGVRVYLFCLMDNHFHLVLETPRGNLSAFMQSLLTGYTVCYNLRHRRHGHLLQGRYGARLVSGDEYLLKLSRYVHLNPVKVKAQRFKPVKERIAYLRDYPWSSYRSYIGLAPRIGWVRYDAMLGLCGDDAKPAAYRCFVEAGLAADDHEFIGAMNKSALSIGSEKYRDWVAEQHAELLGARRHPEDVVFRHGKDIHVDAGEVLEAVAKESGHDVDAVLARRRGGHAWKGIAGWLMLKHTGMTSRDVARCLGFSGGSGVSYQIKRAMQSLADNEDLAKRVRRIEQKWH